MEKENGSAALALAILASSPPGRWRAPTARDAGWGTGGEHTQLGLSKRETGTGREREREGDDQTKSGKKISIKSECRLSVGRWGRGGSQ
jgi:hypothetical protein